MVLFFAYGPELHSDGSMDSSCGSPLVVFAEVCGTHELNLPAKASWGEQGCTDDFCP